MERADRRPMIRTTAIIVAIALLGLLLLLLGGQANISRVAPKSPVLSLMLDGILILIGLRFKCGSIITKAHNTKAVGVCFATCHMSGGRFGNYGTGLRSCTRPLNGLIAFVPQTDHYLSTVRLLGRLRNFHTQIISVITATTLTNSHLLACNISSDKSFISSLEFGQ